MNILIELFIEKSLIITTGSVINKKNEWNDPWWSRNRGISTSLSSHLWKAWSKWDAGPTSTSTTRVIQS